MYWKINSTAKIFIIISLNKNDSTTLSFVYLLIFCIFVKILPNRNISYLLNIIIIMNYDNHNYDDITYDYHN